MSSVVGASVLARVAQEVKQSKERQFTDVHGELLATLPADDLRLLQAASELVARDLVVKVTATPSQRCFYRVESLNKYRRRDRDADTSLDSVTQPFDESMVSGGGANYYNCFSHYCTCAAFHETTVATSATAMVHRGWLGDKCWGRMLQCEANAVVCVWCCDSHTVQAHGCAVAGGRHRPVPDHAGRGRPLRADALSPSVHRRRRHALLTRSVILGT